MISLTRILCPVDFSDFSRRALDYAVGIARWYDARLTALHVLPPIPTFGPPIGEGLYPPLAFSPQDLQQFQDELAGLVMCEVEAGGVEELMQIEMPEYAVAEVTEDPFFTGGHLCRTSRDELARRLGEIR